MFSLFVSHRARKVRSRAFRPSMDSLESKKLLSGSFGLQPAMVVVNDPNSVNVGSHFSFRLVQDNGLPYPAGFIANTTWTVQGALDGRTLDTNGFHDISFGNNGVKTVAGDTVSGYWADTPGIKSISCTVTFNNPTWMGLPIPAYWPQSYVSAVNVAPISATVNFSQVAPTDVYADPESPDGISLGAGATYNVNVQGAPAGSTFGVIQTINSDIIKRYWDMYAIIGTDSNFKPYTFLDNSPDVPGGSLSPYYATHGRYTGQPSVLTISTSNTLQLNDHPSTDVLYDALAVSRFDRFRDDVIVTQANGIPIDVGHFDWSWGGTAVVNSNGSVKTIVSQGPTLNTALYPGGVHPFNGLPKWDMVADASPDPIFLPWLPTYGPVLALLPSGWLTQMQTATNPPTATKPFNDSFDPYAS